MLAPKLFEFGNVGPSCDPIHILFHGSENQNDWHIFKRNKFCIFCYSLSNFSPLIQFINLKVLILQFLYIFFIFSIECKECHYVPFNVRFLGQGNLVMRNLSMHISRRYLHINTAWYMTWWDIYYIIWYSNLITIFDISNILLIFSANKAIEFTHSFCLVQIGKESWWLDSIRVHIGHWTQLLSL